MFWVATALSTDVDLFASLFHQAKAAYKADCVRCICLTDSFGKMYAAASDCKPVTTNLAQMLHLREVPPALLSYTRTLQDQMQSSLAPAGSPAIVLVLHILCARLQLHSRLFALSHASNLQDAPECSSTTCWSAVQVCATILATPPDSSALGSGI